MIRRRTSAPDDLLTLEEAKEQCSVGHADDDALLGRLIKAVSAYLDGPDAKLGRALVTQTWAVDVSPVTGRTSIELPIVPLISLSSITYYDRDNVQQTLNISNDVSVYAENDFAYVAPALNASWPGMYNRPDALTVTYSAGYGLASAVPESIRHAALGLLSHWYENRDAVNIGNITSDVPWFVEELIDMERLGWVG